MHIYVSAIFKKSFERILKEIEIRNDEIST